MRIMAVCLSLVAFFSYMITGLEEDSSYIITVEAMNSIGMATSNTATAMTQEAGNYNYSNNIIAKINFLMKMATF